MKKTGFFKVLGRTDYVVRERHRKINPKKTEVYTYLDFTSNRPEKRADVIHVEI